MKCCAWPLRWKKGQNTHWEKRSSTGPSVKKLELPTLNDFSAIPGKGIRAQLEGRELLLGNPQLLTENQISVQPLMEQIARLSGEGETPMLVALDNQAAGIIAVADIAIEAADVTLISGELTGAVNSIALSKATIRNIKQNMFWAFAYNSLLIPVATGVLFPLFGILLNPMFVAAAMGLSSLTVVGNAVRLRRFQAPISF